MMITGDHHHTAIAVAKDVGMLQSTAPVMVINTLKAPLHSTQAADVAPISASAVAPALAPALAPAGSAVSSRDESAMQPLLQAPIDNSRQSGDATQSQGKVESPRQAVAPQGPSNSQACSMIPARDQPAGAPQLGQTQPAGQRKHGWTVQQPVQSAECSTQASVSEQFRGRSTTQLTASSAASRAAKLVSQRLRGRSSPSLLPMSPRNPLPAHAALEVCSLCFMVGEEQWDFRRALTLLAEGGMQCAVTGDALQLLLQLPDESALMAVLHTAVVYARMKPHQKGQIMDLLGMRGLYQLQGTSLRHIQVC